MDAVQQDKMWLWVHRSREISAVHAGECEQMGEKDGRATQSPDLACQVGKMQLQSWKLRMDEGLLMHCTKQEWSCD